MDLTSLQDLADKITDEYTEKIFSEEYLSRLFSYKWKYKWKKFSITHSLAAGQVKEYKKFISLNSITRFHLKRFLLNLVIQDSQDQLNDIEGTFYIENHKVNSSHNVNFNILIRFCGDFLEFVNSKKELFSFVLRHELQHSIQFDVKSSLLVKRSKVQFKNFNEYLISDEEVNANCFAINYLRKKESDYSDFPSRIRKIIDRVTHVDDSLKPLLFRKYNAFMSQHFGYEIFPKFGCFQGCPHESCPFAIKQE